MNQKLFIVLSAISIGINACAAPTPPPTPTDSGKFTASGFECPEPEFPIEIQSTELNIYVWTEYISRDMKECFELVYKIKVNHKEFSSTEEMYEAVVGGGNYDLIQPTDYIVKRMAEKGLLLELDHSRLPAIKNIDPNYLDFAFDPANRYTVPYLAGTDAIVVNTKKVKTVPSSWADLWKPEYAGKMVFLDEARATIGLTLLTLGYDVNTTNPVELHEAELKLQQLIPNIKTFDSDSPKTSLLAGQVDLGMTWSGEAFLANSENPYIEYIFPTEGVILWQDNWAITSNAEHADAAYAWLNYTMQGNVSWTLLRDWPYTNPNKATLEFAKNNPMSVLDWNGNQTTLGDLYKAYMNSPITNVPASVIRKGHRISDVGDAQALYDKIWADTTGR